MIVFALVVLFMNPALDLAADQVSFATQDGGTIYADVYGKGSHAVVLAHGMRFNKESWAEQAKRLAAEGFRVIAIDFRGYGQSRGPGQKDVMTAPLDLDVLAAARFARKSGAKIVSVIGASLGGRAAADADIESQAGEIDRLVILAATAGGPAEKLKGRKLFIVSRGDSIARVNEIQAQYERAPKPKDLIILDGSAHAQFIFQTNQSERLMREIIRFLSAP